ncbi:uncharacterized protein B0H18DRAFT_992638 [Fomitopsis serialis]|uniref:uncharacterized protein n=1 Tax=Fomitopsis serialis TaxID=139415 RepID=UPI002007C447|nr:uncharacterized protein B0H18DRAFT_992638 [Neoantrodia serialis]KAH9930633.1 hypothetical protein B0H18DRAFT_992638 [Neoantrodia serialis]
MSEDTAGSIGRLNEDVGCRILLELPTPDLLSLSMTCRPLRNTCMPFLFGRSYITIYGPPQVEKPELFLPTSLRPYVHSLVIHDKCLDQRSIHHMNQRLYFTDNYMRCGAFPGSSLSQRLRELSRLRSLTIYKDNSSTHGLSWETLRALLSVPQLHEVKLRWLYFCPDLRPGEELTIDSPAPITSFHYRMYHPRDPFSFPSETAALSAALHSLCETLETIVLCSESAPLSTMPHFHWPRLRKLVFYGMPWTTLPAPFVSLCLGMQSLQSLSLKLYATPSAAPQPLWPSGQSCAFPWPALERLVISFPDPQDEIYDHLPSSLRALSLRCWPHLHVQRRWRGFGFAWRQRDNAMLDSSAMLSILRRCNTLDLDHLEVEYCVDNEDGALLQYVATTFPHLTSLKIHCYQSALGEGRNISVVQIAQSLASLTELRRLKVYLDVVVVSQPDMVPPRTNLQNAAALFAQILSSSLREVVICSKDLPSWHKFQVVGRCAHRLDARLSER